MVNFKEILDSVKNNTCGTELRFDDKGINDEQAVMLAEAFRHNTTIKTLRFGYYKLGAKASLAIAKMLQSEKTGLTTVYLRHIGLTDEGYFAVGKALKTNPNLKSLSLSNNPIKNINAAAALRDGLTENQTLTSLELYENTIDSNTAFVIMQGLVHNKTLRSLDLSSNSIGDDGCRHFAGILRYNHTLQIINFSANWIYPEGGRVLIEALKGNTSLTEMNLVWNYLGGDVCADMLSTLSKTNTTLTLLGLDVNYDLSKFPKLQALNDEFNRNGKIQSIRKDIDSLRETISSDVPKLESKESVEDLSRKREKAVAILERIKLLAKKGYPQTTIKALNDALTTVAGHLINSNEGEKEQRPALILSASSPAAAGSVGSVKSEDGVSSEPKPRKLSAGDRKS